MKKVGICAMGKVCSINLLSKLLRPWCWSFSRTGSCRSSMPCTTNRIGRRGSPEAHDDDRMPVFRLSRFLVVMPLTKAQLQMSQVQHARPARSLCMSTVGTSACFGCLQTSPFGPFQVNLLACDLAGGMGSRREEKDGIVWTPSKMIHRFGKDCIGFLAVQRATFMREIICRIAITVRTWLFDSYMLSLGLKSDWSRGLFCTL